MTTASNRVVTVFGGTGFLGRSVVRHLRMHGFCVRVGSRHPDRGHASLDPDDPQLRSIKVDVRDARSVADALTDAYGAVNAVSLYRERGRETFHSIHVESAERIAAHAQRCGAKRLIHVSGIGADARSQSLYIRKRGEGEMAVREAFADAILMPFGQKIEAVEAIVPGVASSGAVPQSMPSIADNYTRKNRRSLR
jgi:uncharacterized protein YbjT (DUF2867 family)